MFWSRRTRFPRPNNSTKRSKVRPNNNATKRNRVPRINIFNNEGSALLFNNTRNVNKQTPNNSIKLIRMNVSNQNFLRRVATILEDIVGNNKATKHLQEYAEILRTGNLRIVEPPHFNEPYYNGPLHRGNSVSTKNRIINAYNELILLQKMLIVFLAVIQENPELGKYLSNKMSKQKIEHFKSLFKRNTIVSVTNANDGQGTMLLDLIKLTFHPITGPTMAIVTVPMIIIISTFSLLSYLSPLTYDSIQRKNDSIYSLRELSMIITELIISRENKIQFEDIKSELNFQNMNEDEINLIFSREYIIKYYKDRAEDRADLRIPNEYRNNVSPL